MFLNMLIDLRSNNKTYLTLKKIKNLVHLLKISKNIRIKKDILKVSHIIILKVFIYIFVCNCV